MPTTRQQKLIRAALTAADRGETIRFVLTRQSRSRNTLTPGAASDLMLEIWERGGKFTLSTAPCAA